MAMTFPEDSPFYSQRPPNDIPAELVRAPADSSATRLTNLYDEIHDIILSIDGHSGDGSVYEALDDIRNRLSRLLP